MDALSACYTKDPNFIPRDIAGEWILVPIRRLPDQPDLLFVLNGVGGFIWNQLSETAPAAAVRDRLVETFDVSNEQATQDVTALLAQLESIGAIHPAASVT